MTTPPATTAADEPPGVEPARPAATASSAPAGASSADAARPVTAYLFQGGFGREVVRRLASHQDPVLDVSSGLVPAFVPYADRLVLVADPDQEALREALDSLSFTRSIPSVGLELLPTELRCGPLVVPGRTACYRCYMRRRRQHGYRPLPAGPGPLPQGYAYHHVVTAIGLVALALDGIQERGPFSDETGDTGGQVWTVDLVAGTTASSRVVAVDRCPTCSGRYAAGRDGVPALAGLLGHRARSREGCAGGARTIGDAGSTGSTGGAGSTRSTRSTGDAGSTRGEVK